ncbi:MAG TPA: hypothetical protein VIU15_17515 [Streptomyces sp.]
MKDAVVSSPHEAMHRIFQEDPGIFARAARAIGIPVADVVSSTELSVDASENFVLERRIDTLLCLETVDTEKFLLVVEAQRKKDRGKPASWAYYLAYVYAKYGIPPVLVVVCEDSYTAEWAAQQVDIGPKYWKSLMLRPIVLGPDNVPVFTTAEQAARDIPMTVLSAILHNGDPEVRAILEALAPALRGLQERDETAAERYAELTAQGLDRSPYAEFWRELVAIDTSFFVSSMSEGIREEGREQGREQGRAVGRAEAILRLLDRRGVPVSDSDRDLITSCTDLPTLDRWFDRAITATTADEIFAGDSSL